MNQRILGAIFAALLFVGLILFILGLVFPGIARSSLEDSITEFAVNKRENYDSEQEWIDSFESETPYWYVMYNVTNLPELLADNTVKPVLQRRRYAFLEEEYKYDVVVTPGEYRYKSWKKYIPQDGTTEEILKSEMITMPNPVYATLMSPYGAETEFVAGGNMAQSVVGNSAAAGTIFGELNNGASDLMTGLRITAMASFLGGQIALHGFGPATSLWNNSTEIWSLNQPPTNNGGVDAATIGYLWNPASNYSLLSTTATTAWALALGDYAAGDTARLDAIGAEIAAASGDPVGAATATLEVATWLNYLAASPAGETRYAYYLGALLTGFPTEYLSDADKTIINTAAASGEDAWAYLGAAQWGNGTVTKVMSYLANPSGPIAISLYQMGAWPTRALAAVYGDPLPEYYAYSVMGTYADGSPVGGDMAGLSMTNAKELMDFYGGSTSHCAGGLSALFCLCVFNHNGAFSIYDSGSGVAAVRDQFTDFDSVKPLLDMDNGGALANYFFYYLPKTFVLEDVLQGPPTGDGTYAGSGLFITQSAWDWLFGWNDNALAVFGQDPFFGGLISNEAVMENLTAWQQYKADKGDYIYEYSYDNGDGPNGLETVGENIVWRDLDQFTTQDEFNRADVGENTCVTLPTNPAIAAFGRTGCIVYRQPEVIAGVTNYGRQITPSFDKDDHVKPASINLWVPDVRRGVNFTYEGKEEIKGIEMDRYRVKLAELAIVDSPNGDRYFTEVDGHLNLDIVYPGPFFAAGEGQYGTDPTERAKFTGVEWIDWIPSAEFTEEVFQDLYGVAVWVDPISGFMLKGRKAMMLGVKLGIETGLNTWSAPFVSGNGEGMYRWPLMELINEDIIADEDAVDLVDAYETYRGYVEGPLIISFIVLGGGAAGVGILGLLFVGSQMWSGKKFEG